jgi:hypothetical protein
MNNLEKIISIDVSDRASIDYLIGCLFAPILEVRYHAYCKLKSGELDLKTLSVQEINIIELGVLLNPGDLVWSVYRSGLTYDDSHYYVCDFSDDSGTQTYGQEVDVSYYNLWNNGVACKLMSTHIDIHSAETAVHQTIKNILTEDEYPYSACFGSHYSSLKHGRFMLTLSNSIKMWYLSLSTHPGGGNAPSAN